MADLRNQQLKDRYQTLVTLSDTGSDPATGTLQNGRGTPITGLTLDGTLSVTKIIPTGNVTAGNGMYLPAENIIAFSTDGIEAIRVNANQDVRIGSSGALVSGLLVSRATGSATPTPVEMRLQSTTNASNFSLTDPWSRLSFYSSDSSGGGPKIHASIDAVMRQVQGTASILKFNVSNINNATLSTALEIFDNTGVNAMAVYPGTDNAQKLGLSGNRWSEIWAGGIITGGKFSPTSDTVTGNGMYLPAENEIAISSNSVERFRMKSNGDIRMSNNLMTGAAVTSQEPLSPLHSNVAGTSSVALGLTVSAHGNGNPGRGTGILIQAPGSGNTVSVAQIDGLQNSNNAIANNAALVFNVANTSGELTERLRINSTGAITADGRLSAGKLVPTANTTAGNGMYLPTTNTVAIGTNGSERIRFNASGSIGFGVTNPAGLVDYASGLKTYRTTNAAFNKYNITKLYGATNAQTVLQITVPATNTTFVYIKMSFANSRANSTNLGISAVGERYFAISRNGSGSNVVLDSNIGSKDWTGLSSSAGSVRDVDTYTATIVRNGAEANTDPQVVNITFDGQAAGFFCYAILDFEILSHNPITIV